MTEQEHPEEQKTVLDEELEAVAGGVIGIGGFLPQTPQSDSTNSPAPAAKPRERV